ncbi:MAG: hypothetical protein HYY01_14295 [Chloroflexi bacterium]|nr:hypothetical protein [Chloroflexota bacterium]
MAARWGRAPQASWHAVPRINLLGGGGRGHRWVVRVVLALLLLGSLYLFLSLYQEGSAQQRELDLASSRLKATQTQLASRRDEVNRLEVELRGLQQRLGAQQGLPQQPGSDRWQAALAALEGLQGGGVQFLSLQGKADDELTVVALATGEQPLARLQARLLEAGQPFELQGVQWKQDKGVLTLTATLRVGASP